MNQKESIKKDIKLSEIYRYNKDVSFIRMTIVICIFLYSGFGILDWILYKENLQFFLFIRLGVLLPYMLLILGLSYTKYFRRISQILLIILFFLAGGGIVIMIYTISGDNYYTNGLYLVYAIGFYLIRLKWINATLAFFMVLIFFITIGMFTSSLSNIDIYIHTFFYLSFAIIGIFGGYFNDKFNKEQYIYEVENERNESKLKDRINIQLKKLNDSHKATIVSIATLAESRDILTGNHLSRVATLSTMFAERIPEEFYTQNGVVKEEFLESIELTSILHDIGKIAVSDKILNKPAKLSHDEYETIKTHTTIGAKTLAMIKETDRDNLFVSQGIEIAQHHHERWDGLGYPNGLSGNDIPLSARIVAIIDVYDALISKRPYKEKFSKSKSISIIKEGKNTMFDPTLTDIFTKMAENSNNIELFWK